MVTELSSVVAAAVYGSLHFEITDVKTGRPGTGTAADPVRVRTEEDSSPTARSDTTA